MRRAMTLSRALILIAAIGLAVGADAISESASAQPYPSYQCPVGYYWDPYYGCLPVGYYYGPPYYVYPNFGFDFFYGYGPSYGYGHGGYGHGGAPHGGGGAPHGGGGGHR